MPLHHRRSAHAHHHAPAHADVQVREAMADPDLQTVVSVVYVTASKTFSGPAVYVTNPTAALAEPASTSPESAQTTKDADSKSDSNDSTSSATKDPSTTPTAAAKTGTTLSVKTTLATSVSADTFSISAAAAATDASSSADVNSTASLVAAANQSTDVSSEATASASSTASSSSSSSGDMSSGAKAGLAIGILFAIAAVLGLVLLFYRKKKRQQQQEHSRLEDEKQSFNPGADLAAGGARAASVRTARTGNAPRLSLRPVTEFSPNLEHRKSAGNKLEMPTPLPSASAWEKHGSEKNANDPANPFGNHAETPSTAKAVNPFGRSAEIPETPINEDAVALPTPTTPGTPAAFAGPEILRPGSTTGAPKSFSIDSDTAIPPGWQNPSDWTSGDVPPSPGPAPSGALPAIASAIAGARPSPNNVHRVQMDFKPSMEDELELNAGQLVRMLHEYDDGWALCRRMDRSQQGVAPRTCLSKHAVKPRPAGPRGPPPAAPAGAPGTRSPPGGPGMNQGRPMSPASGRNSPGFHGPQQGRPASPGGRGRSQSNAVPGGRPRAQSNARPAPRQDNQNRRRSNSVGSATGRRTPPGPSPLAARNQDRSQSPASRIPTKGGAAIPNRKPVPGQAI